MTKECEHHWACPGALNAPTENGVLILLPLYCTRCGECQTKVAPPPEVPQNKIARAQLVPNLTPQLQRR